MAISLYSGSEILVKLMDYWPLRYKLRHAEVTLV